MTFLIVVMKSPGIDMRPLTEMTGEDWFNEVFFDKVRVPIDNVVDEIEGGWDIVINTLSRERVSSALHAPRSLDHPAAGAGGPRRSTP